MKKIHQVHANQKKAEILQISFKVDFRPKNITRNKEIHFIMISGLGHLGGSVS